MIDRYYAGIGSRETPLVVLQDMVELAQYLSESHILNSGGAGGADSAFEKGALRKQIFLPFDGFNGRVVDGESYLTLTGDIEKRAKKIAEYYHPAWNRCGFAARRFHTRNVAQVLGKDLDTPVEFVICYTERGLLKGGTATAIRIAKDHAIPVFNLGSMTKNDILYRLKEYLK